MLATEGGLPSTHLERPGHTIFHRFYGGDKSTSHQRDPGHPHGHRSGRTAQWSAGHEDLGQTHWIQAADCERRDLVIGRSRSNRGPLPRWAHLSWPSTWPVRAPGPGHTRRRGRTACGARFQDRRAGQSTDMTDRCAGRGLRKPRSGLLSLLYQHQGEYLRVDHPSGLGDPARPGGRPHGRITPSGATGRLKNVSTDMNSRWGGGPDEPPRAAGPQPRDDRSRGREPGMKTPPAPPTSARGGPCQPRP